MVELLQKVLSEPPVLMKTSGRHLYPARVEGDQPTVDWLWRLTLAFSIGLTH